MGTNFLDRETANAFAAIRRYQKAFERLSTATPTIEVARAEFDAALQTLITALEHPAIVAKMMTVMASRNGADELPTGGELRIPLGELELEINLSVHFGLRPKEVRERLLAAVPGDGAPRRLESVEQVLSELKRFHGRLIADLESARQHKRGAKKRRKRKLGQGVTSLLFGTGVLIANSYAVVQAGLPTMAFSYTVSLTAFHQAARDIIGEEE